MFKRRGGIRSVQTDPCSQFHTCWGCGYNFSQVTNSTGCQGWETRRVWERWKKTRSLYCCHLPEYLLTAPWGMAPLHQEEKRASVPPQTRALAKGWASPWLLPPRTLNQWQWIWHHHLPIVTKPNTKRCPHVSGLCCSAIVFPRAVHGS